MFHPLAGKPRSAGIPTKTEKIPLEIGVWNVRMLMDTDGSDRSQLRAALIGTELDIYRS